MVFHVTGNISTLIQWLKFWSTTEGDCSYKDLSLHTNIFKIKCIDGCCFPFFLFFSFLFVLSWWTKYHCAKSTVNKIKATVLGMICLSNFIPFHSIWFNSIPFTPVACFLLSLNKYAKKRHMKNDKKRMKNGICLEPLF